MIERAKEKVRCRVMASNKALHRTAIPLRDIAAGELWR